MFQGVFEKLCVTAPLGKSVHSIITMDLNCSHDVPKNKVYNQYDKGDYNKFNRMMDLDWDELYINAKGDVNSQWMIFKELYQKALEESVPRSSGNRRGKSHAIPLDRKTRTKIKRKERLWSNYRKSGDLTVYKDYCRTRNQVRRITRKKQVEYEKSLAKQVKENPKKFWQYANSKEMEEM